MKTNPLIALDADELEVLIRYHDNKSLQLGQGDEAQRHQKRAEHLNEVKRPEAVYAHQ